ncbi:hypothetical protein K438DRAFT_1609541 [Mycena galopus ATCC 62051]|nr:hypothetical protein K438DRAFT_1609541 [Mycena galopus ATCC 62051]
MLESTLQLPDFGPGAPRNSGVRIWGNQTNSRAELIALLLALISSPLRTTLQISTRSEYAIRSVKYYATQNQVCGWTCPNGDVLRLIIQWVYSRSAPLYFIHVKKNMVDGHLKSAAELAKQGCAMP